MWAPGGRSRSSNTGVVALVAVQRTSASLSAAEGDSTRLTVSPSCWLISAAKRSAASALRL